jgi:hypothetical protein
MMSIRVIRRWSAHPRREGHTLLRGTLRREWRPELETGKGYTTGSSIDLDHHDGEGEHHDYARGQGGRGGKRELEGSGGRGRRWQGEILVA